MGFLKNLFSSKDQTQKTDPSDFSEGDLFYTTSEKGYNVYKLLVFERDVDCYHVLHYESSAIKPTADSLNNLKVVIYHAPVSKDGFRGAIFLVNKPVIAADLIGYHEYLRNTRSPDYYFDIANDYYLAGLDLTDVGKQHEAIDSYSKAIDLIPTFFEAIDNRAFCEMNLGNWDGAIAGFEKSLIVNPDSLLAEFSIGECYLNLNNHKQAKSQFEKAIAIDPSYQPAKDFWKRAHDLSASEE